MGGGLVYNVATPARSNIRQRILALESVLVDMRNDLGRLDALVDAAMREPFAVCPTPSKCEKANGFLTARRGPKQLEHHLSSQQFGQERGGPNDFTFVMTYTGTSHST